MGRRRKNWLPVNRIRAKIRVDHGPPAGLKQEDIMKRNPIFRRFAAALLAALLMATVSGCAQSGDDTGNWENPYGLTARIEDGAILHAWCWSFRTITESMQDIAWAGYSAIQTSPANECIVGANGGLQLNGEGKWYYHYQPTDWTIGNYQLGTREEFTAMCQAAHEYGIKVIVDVVPNHTTPTLESVSQNLIDAAGGMDELYHENGFTEIVHWDDRLECTTGQMGGLPDVNTENRAFQDYFITYLNECIACGADGFRYDTAKHIGLPDDPKDPKSEENNFWARVTSEIDSAERIFNYGEVLQGDGERIEEYQKAIGGTTASDFGGAVRQAVTSGRLDAGELRSLRIDMDDPTAVTWVESHDNYCNDGTSVSLSEDQVIQAWAIVCARGSGTPLFYDRPYGATASNMWGPMNHIGAAGSPFYKDPRVVAVNRFRNAMVGEPQSLTNPEGEASVLLIERGEKGAVIVNSGRYSYNLNTKTALPDGVYVNRADGETEYTVSGGVLTGTILSGGVAVLCNDGWLDIPPLPTVSLETESFILSDGPVETVLHVEGADSGTFSLNGGPETPFEEGQKLEIAVDGLASGEAYPVKLKAAGTGGGETTMTYYFTVQGKRSVDAGITVYFQKPEDWGDTISAYVYDESTGAVREAAPWPGVACEAGSDGLYSYTFDESWDNVLVIFTDGKNQVPGAMEPGMVVEADKVYTAG